LIHFTILPVSRKEIVAFTLAALPGIMEEVENQRAQLLGSELFQTLVDRAHQSPRLRTNHNFHLSLDDNPGRFLNVMAKGTYIAPHRHIDPPKSESFLVLDGEIAFFTFDDAG